MFKKLACAAAVVGTVVTVGMGVAVAADDAGGVSVFGKAIYLRGEMDDCPWDKLTDKCLIKKVGEKVYMATAELKVDWAPYKFKFGDASWTAGTNFGYASESKPGIYDFAKGTPIKLNPNAVFEEVKVTPPHDGKYDFYLDASGDGPVVYIKEHK